MYIHSALLLIRSQPNTNLEDKKIQQPGHLFPDRYKLTEAFIKPFPTKGNLAHRHWYFCYCVNCFYRQPQVQQQKYTIKPFPANPKCYREIPVPCQLFVDNTS